jgi:ADP-heptose:LPS heptosyltransferase
MPAVNKVLVLCLTRMGDIIQTTPFLRRLRQKHPAAEIHVLVEECFAEVAELAPGVDRIHRVRLEDLLPPLAADGSGNLARALGYYNDVIGSLRAEAYDEVWNLTHTRPATLLNFLLAGEHGKGVTLDENGFQRVNSPWLRYFFATNHARPWCQFNLADIYANCIDDIDPLIGRSIAVRVDQKRGRSNRKSDSKRIALHLGASQKTKQWPVTSFREVAEKLILRNWEIILVGGPKDVRLGDSFNGVPLITNRIGMTSPRELAITLSDCDLLITNDSGPMHVAAAVGTPVMAITVGSALGSETAPYGEGHIVIEPQSACFPCSPNGSCANPVCAADILPETVASLAVWKMTKERLYNISDFSRCRVYQTTFSSDDGMLRLDRIFGNTPFLRDELNDLIRPIWLQVLNGRCAGSSAEIHGDLIDKRLVLHALDLADKVKASAEHIVRLAQGHPSPVRAIQKLGNELTALESELAGLMGRHGLLKSLHAFTTLSRASLTGDTLLDQANETVEIYRQLIQLLSGLITVERDVSINMTYSTHHHKVKDENYA